MFGGEDKTATASHSVPNSGLTRSNTKFNSTVDGNEYEISVMVGTLFVAHHKIIQLAMIAPHVKHVRYNRFGVSRAFSAPTYPTHSISRCMFPRGSDVVTDVHFPMCDTPVAPTL